MLANEARELGYPLYILRLLVMTHRMNKVVRIGTATASPLIATRGITAGSGPAAFDEVITHKDNRPRFATSTESTGYLIC